MPILSQQNNKTSKQAPPNSTARQNTKRHRLTNTSVHIN